MKVFLLWPTVHTEVDRVRGSGQSHYDVQNEKKSTLRKWDRDSFFVFSCDGLFHDTDFKKYAINVILIHVMSCVLYPVLCIAENTTCARPALWKHTMFVVIIRSYFRQVRSPKTSSETATVTNRTVLPNKHQYETNLFFWRGKIGSCGRWSQLSTR